MLFARGPVIKSGPPLGEPPIPPPSSISSGSENLPSSVQQGHFLHTPKPSPPTILPDTIQVTETTTPTPSSTRIIWSTPDLLRDKSPGLASRARGRTKPDRPSSRVYRKE